jgi:hypothetical protein
MADILFVHYVGLSDVHGASQNLVGTYCGCARQTEDYSFGNDQITDSVSVTPPSVAEASLYSALFCVFIARVRYNLDKMNSHL